MKHAQPDNNVYIDNSIDQGYVAACDRRQSLDKTLLFGIAHRLDNYCVKIFAINRRYVLNHLMTTDSALK